PSFEREFRIASAFARSSGSSSRAYSVGSLGFLERRMRRFTGRTIRKKTDGDQEERDQRVDDEAVAEDAAVDRERELGEVGLAEDRGDERREEALHQRRDDRRERDAEHHGDRQVDHVPRS